MREIQEASGQAIWEASPLAFDNLCVVVVRRWSILLKNQILSKALFLEHVLVSSQFQRKENNFWSYSFQKKPAILVSTATLVYSQ